MNKKIHILLLEDDPNLGTIIQDHLVMNKFDVTLCPDGVAGLREWKKGNFDLCLVDIMMPKMDGFSFVEAIRSSDKDIPVIFLTAKSLKEDKIKGFRMGCDDYITKPFSIEELLLRIEAVLKRTGHREVKEISGFALGKYNFDHNRQLLSIKDKQHKLTSRESDLLLLLCKNMNKVVERDHALREIWNDDSFFAGRSMDVFISKLRKYLKDDPSVEIIGVHGRGFRLVVSGKSD